MKYSLRFNAVLDISHYGLLHLFRGAGVVVDSVTDVCNAMMKCVFIVKRSCIYSGCLGVLIDKSSEDSNLASVEPMQLMDNENFSHSAWLKLAAAPVCILSALIQQIKRFLTHVDKCAPPPLCFDVLKSCQKFDCNSQLHSV
jgi:hypothetical protein